VELHRLAAFTRNPEGGNPAGIALLDAHPDDATMLAVAADIGYSETAFLVPDGPRRHRVRYFAPITEVSFCGHATIAAGVVLAERDGPGPFTIVLANGTEVPVDTQRDPDGAVVATLTSPPPSVDPIDEADLTALLSALRWDRTALDPALPASVAWAGARHPILPAASRPQLASLDYDFDALADLMAQRDWTTVDLVWRQTASRWHARNAFAIGGVVEDPATGAAAAAFGGWLRHHGLVELPATVTIEQGVDLGRPSLISVQIDPGRTGIRVSGHAVPLAPTR